MCNLVLLTFGGGFNKFDKLSLVFRVHDRTKVIFPTFNLLFSASEKVSILLFNWVNLVESFAG